MKKLTFVLGFILLGLFTFAQQSINLTQGKTAISLESSSQNSIVLKNNLSNISTDLEPTDQGLFRTIEANGYRNNFDNQGKPDLPVKSQLIEIPHGASLTVEIIEYDETIIDLDNLGSEKIMPAQPSYPKSVDPDTIQMIFDQSYYSQNNFSNYDLVTAEEVGIMRGVRIGRVNVCPFDYNPVSNELRIKYNIKFKVNFVHADFTTTDNQKNKYYSPEFEGSYSKLINYTPPASKDAITQFPIKYVIISDPAFETDLQPFINWKTKSGYKIIEAYLGVDVNNSTTAIQSYLQNLYNNGTPSDPAPTYVLFVGDYDNLTAWDGNTGSHVSDLYYCTFDGGGDFLPEMYWGRLSATNSSQLNNALDKIIPYEQYDLPSGSFLNECVMVAGVDGSFAPSHGDGQIYYGINEYFNNAHGYTNIYAYYYSLTSGPYHVMSSNSGGASSDIISKVSNGVGFANYTAHCNYNGWGDPSFTNSDMSGLSNINEYPLMIGNCCLSNKFDVDDSFGEMIVYAQDKGAIGYIGGTNNTYWDEDFWWGVGVNSISISQSNADQHTYANTNQGAYDGNWHENGEPFNEWYITARQMAHCGNMAVTEAGSSREQYYWEIYQLTGDPSLMPYMTEPDALTVSYSSPLIGANSLVVSTEPYTYVAISQNDSLWDAKWSGSSSSVTLSFDPINNTDSIDIVLTKQNKIPHIAKIAAIPPNPPTADFSGTPLTIYEGETVDFTDLSQYATSWSWHFGDGATSSQQNPSHTYTTAGYYTVDLGVSNTMGYDSISKPNYVHVIVNTNPPTVDFTADQTTVPVGSTVNFTDLTINNPSGWEWTFPGGTPSGSGAQNPSVVYNTAGSYDVKLKATNTYGQDSLLKPAYINVILDYCSAGSNEDSNGEYIANVDLNTISNSSGNSSYTDFTSVSTDLTLGQSYQIDVLNGYDQYDQDEVIVWIDYNIDGDFDDIGEEVWTSAVGTGAPTPFSGTINVPSSASIGQTRMRIRMHDTQNNPNFTPCGNSDWGEVEDYTVNLVSPNTPPTAAFSSTDTSTCTGEVQFTDASLLATSWSWDFGDGTSSTQQNPLHLYSSDGVYSVKLTVSNAYGTDSVTYSNYITVDMPDAPVVSGASNCGPGSMTLNASTSGSGDLVWFADDVTSSSFHTGNSLTETFTNTTTYYVAEQIPSNLYSAGKSDNSGTGDYFTSPYEHGLIFDAYTDFTINSVKVYADGAANRTIRLLDNTDQEIASVTLNIPDGESRVDLNFFVPTGNDYTLMGPTSPDMYRDGGNGAPNLPYPYDVPGLLSIKDNTADDLKYYYYFYDWEVEEGSTCVSPRVPVTATVHSLPAPDIGSDQNICETSTAVFDAGSGYTNYQWTGGSSSQSITVSTAMTYSVTVTDNNGCTGSDAAVLTVDTMPDATINSVSSLCENDLPVVLTAVSTGGTWSGTGVVNGNEFDPNVAGSGTHTVSYQITNGMCSDSDSEDITVDALPSPSIDPVSALCVNDQAVVLTANISGGTWSGTGVVNGNEFDPAIAGIGSHTISYEVVNGSCSATDQITVNVSDQYDATISSLSDVCEDSSPVTLTAADGGGVWSGTGVSGNQFDPMIAGAGDHVITYTISGNCGDTDTETIHVDSIISLTINDPGSMCENDNPVILTANVSGGNWSGTGVVNGNEFDPTVAGSGNHTISYEYTNGACLSTDQLSIEVIAQSDASINSLSDVCEDASPVSLTAADGGGVWSGSGVSGNLFDPSAAGPGDHVITYIISGMCGDTDTETIHVDSLVLLQINDPGSMCDDDNILSLTANVTGGVWSGTGVVNTDDFDPSAAGVGVHTITYEYVNGACTSTDDLDIEVGSVPDVTVNVTDASSSTSSDGSATAIPAGGLSPYVFVWSNGDTDGTMEDVEAGQYSLTVTDAAGCDTVLTVEVDFLNSIVEKESGVKIYPNPADELLYIEMTNIRASGLSLVNILGQSVLEKEISRDIEELDLSGIEEGVYFIRIETAGEDILRKIMIK